MQRIYILLIMGMLCIHTTQSLEATPQYQQCDTFEKLSKKSTTILLYMAADNYLQGFPYYNIAELLHEGSNDTVNLLVHLNTRLPNQKKVTQKLFIEKDKVIQIGDDTPLDSGLPSTLISAYEWAHTSFPSEQFVLVIWGNSAGPFNNKPLINDSRWSYLPRRAISIDGTSGNFLSDADLHTAISTICSHYRNNKPLDIVVCESCYACIEIAYAIQPYAHYLVSSQVPVPLNGCAYDALAAYLTKKPLDIAGAACDMARAFQKKYESDHHALSVVSLDRLPPLVHALNEIANELVTALQSSQKNSVLELLREIVSSPTITTFARHDYNLVDIGNLISCLSKHSEKLYPDSAEFSTMLSSARNSLNDVIMANKVSTKYPEATGLSIYVPLQNAHPAYENMLWKKESSWGKMCPEK